MPRFAAVSRHHVTSALDDYAATGSEDFVLMHGGRAYGAQAVLSAAHQKATGNVVLEHDWASKDQAARVLRELGFRVLAGDDPEAVVPITGHWREVSEVGADAAREAWAQAAREVLLEAARRYRARVVHKELAIEVQRRSGIRTKQLMHHWVGEVLGRTALVNAERDEPLLCSLCVTEDERVSDAYAVAVQAAYGDKPDNPNAHAARERLECYRYFEAAGLPADGGSVEQPLPPSTARTPTGRAPTGRAPTRRAATPRRSAAPRPAKPQDRPLEICPTCFMAMPRSGICDNCA